MRLRWPRVGLFNTAQQIGGAVGLAIVSTLATDRAAADLRSSRRSPTVVVPA